MNNQDKIKADINKLTELNILPKSQKELSKFFGVRESTYNGWVNNKNFPDYAYVIVLNLFEIDKLKNKVIELDKKINLTIPIYYKEKTLLVKLKQIDSAIFQYNLTGNVIATCDNVDNATEILDKINL